VSSSTQNQRSGRYSVVFQKSAKSISLVISASQLEDSVKSTGSKSSKAELETYVPPTAEKSGTLEVTGSHLVPQPCYQL
ncbi:hypothetical protein A6R68_15608, partial [Neotoma lepida]